MAWKTTDDPRTHFVTLRLTDSELADVDDYAAKRGYTRSSAVRDCVDRVIEIEKKRAKRGHLMGLLSEVDKDLIAAKYDRRTLVSLNALVQRIVNEHVAVALDQRDLADRDLGSQINPHLMITTDEARREKALGMAVEIGVAAGWGSGGVVTAAGRFEAFLKGEPESVTPVGPLR